MIDDVHLLGEANQVCRQARESGNHPFGTLVFGVTERRLAEQTGDNPENLTMSLRCQTILGAGQRKIGIRGPFPELEEEIVKIHEGFW